MTNCFDIDRRPTVRRSELLRRFITEDSGQDLVEYGLLAAFIGIAGWVTLLAIDETVLATYQSWLDPTSGTPSVWEPPEPIPEP